MITTLNAVTLVKIIAQLIDAQVKGVESINFFFCTSWKFTPVGYGHVLIVLYFIDVSSHSLFGRNI
jgi:hypothetical protein